MVASGILVGVVVVGTLLPKGIVVSVLGLILEELLLIIIVVIFVVLLYFSVVEFG